MSSTFERRIGAHTLSIETGRLAQQANGSVLLRYGDSVLLVTATMSKPREGIDFFPLTIDFEERLYARGKIPGSFFRREGRPSTDGILIDRLTDRPIRPLFPKGFRNEIQIIITPLSTDLETPLDTLAVIGASASLGISDIPFEGPLGTTRIGHVGGDYIINPTYQQLANSDLDLVVAGTRDGVLMMEAGASELSESMVLDGIRRAQEANLEVIDLLDETIASVGKPKVEFEAPETPEGIVAEVTGLVGGRLSAAFDSNGDKSGQEDSISLLKSEVVEALQETYDAPDIKNTFESLIEDEVRTRILQRGQRPDGRSPKDLRPISADVGILPRTHGTGLFSRGETQVLGIVTLGSVGDAQRLDNLSPAESKRFLLHYNFPPFSVGETRRVGTPNRRSIGHGALAERALQPVLPDEDEFPYTIRAVSEVLSSNGSTSMGSVCAITLALMDAGVPIKAPVAGISIGLVTGDNGERATLTDIQGVEDHTGDMDFKVAGTAEGITAIQLDIKVKKIDFDVIEAALEQAKETRLRILGHMREAIAEPRSELSPYAPRMVRISIPVDKIGAVIGPGGKTIRGIVEQTGATVDVQDDGSVFIGSADGAASRKAVEMVENLTKTAKIGEVYTGKVVKILPSGAFVAILPGQDGLVHISQLANEFVRSVEDVVSLGEEITVVVTGVDPSGRISLSRRALLEGDEDAEGEHSGTTDTERPEPSFVQAGGDRGPRPGERRPDSERRPEGGGPQSGYRQPRQGPGRRGGGPRGDSRSDPRPFRGGGGPPRGDSDSGSRPYREPRR